jgi:uncharacterized DUF497 family protein
MVYNEYIFEFDPEKSRQNQVKNGINFLKAQELWQSPHVEITLRTEGELRWAVVGIIENLFWTSIITKRRDKIRIISVRRSRREEKEIYQSGLKCED